MTSKWTVTGDIATLLSGDWDSVTAYLEPSTTTGFYHDTATGKSLVLHRQPITVAADGTFTVANVPDSSETGLSYTITATPTLNSVKGAPVRSDPFTVNADTTFDAAAFTNPTISAAQEAANTTSTVVSGLVTDTTSAARTAMDGVFVNHVNAQADLPDATLHTDEVWVWEAADGTLHGSKSNGTSWVEVLAPTTYTALSWDTIAYPGELWFVWSGSTATFGSVASAAGESGWLMPPTGTNELALTGQIVPDYWGSFDVYLQWSNTATTPTGTGVVCSINHAEHIVGSDQTVTDSSVTTTMTEGAENILVETQLLAGITNNGGAHRFRITRNGDSGADTFSANVYYQRIVLKRAS